MDDSDRDLPQAPPSLADRPSPRWKWVFLAVVLVYVYLQMTGALGRSRATGVDAKAVGRKLPGLELQALTGDSQDLTLAELNGKVAVINFWATWCPPCQAELPEIAALWVELRDRPDVMLLPVSCDGVDADLAPLREKTKEFLAQKGLQLPTYGDRSEGTRHAVSIALDDSGFAFPTTLVIDQTGVIRGVWVGYKPGVGDELKNLVVDLLKNKS